MSAYMTGAAVGLDSLSGLKFNPAASNCGCRLCGEVYQSAHDRKLLALLNEPVRDHAFIERVKEQADYLRRVWTERHSLKHSQAEHDSLARSGEWCTPEAALKLTPLGIFPLQSDPSSEVAAAMLEAPRAPVNDVEGT